MCLSETVSRLCASSTVSKELASRTPSKYSPFCSRPAAQGTDSDVINQSDTVLLILRAIAGTGSRSNLIIIHELSREGAWDDVKVINPLHVSDLAALTIK